VLFILIKSVILSLNRSATNDVPLHFVPFHTYCFTQHFTSFRSSWWWAQATTNGMRCKSQTILSRARQIEADLMRCLFPVPKLTTALRLWLAFGSSPYFASATQGTRRCLILTERKWCSAAANRLASQHQRFNQRKVENKKQRRPSIVSVRKEDGSCSYNLFHSVVAACSFLERMLCINTYNTMQYCFSCVIWKC